MQMRKNIVCGNWKMNLLPKEANALVQEIIFLLHENPEPAIKKIIAPPFVYLDTLFETLKKSNIKLSGQNCASKNSGAFTGEVSANMIHSVGAEYVIVGHSERRNYFSETPEMLAEKVNRCLENNLCPIFCVGEKLDERNSNQQFEVVEKQLKESLFHLDKNNFSKLIIAYEPVWAIGTGVTATSEQAQEMHHYIRKIISEKYTTEIAEKISILYGGSCNASNAKELFSCADIDGGLIGGASLKAADFVAIIHSFPTSEF